MKDFRNRIVGHADVAPDQLLAHPLNFRRHSSYQQSVMAAALGELGWLDEIIVNRRTQHTLNGHMRVEIALREGVATVPVKYVDLTEEEELKALATFDPIGGLAFSDPEAVASLANLTTFGDEALATFAQGMRQTPATPYQPEPAGPPPPMDEHDDPYADVDPDDPNAAPVPAEDTEERQGSDGSLLALVDVTIAEPTHQVSKGDVWKLGPSHRLICADVIAGWGEWIEYLKPGVLFCPYPGPFVALTLKADVTPLVLVQPNAYIAGHILDRYAEVKGAGAVERAHPR